MKRQFRKSQKIVKGMPSAVVLSILIHAALFLLAGMLVVFTVVKKEDKKFESPKAAERPKIKLRKPKVKIDKTSRPKQTRIVTKNNRATMPDIQLPEMGGMGDGLGGDFGGFDMMPALDDVSIFGSGQSIGNDLEGVIYDFKRRRDGKKFAVSIGPEDIASLKVYVEDFLKSGWKTSSVSRFYRSPKKLYASAIMIPPTESSLGPWAFGEREMEPYQYMMHYKGQLIHREGIKFRFVCMADNYLLIRVDGQVVLDYKNQFEHVLRGQPFKSLNYHLGHWFAYASNWIELEPGVPKDVDFILGDYKGGLFAAMIAVEVEGVDYPTTPLPLDNPQLPIFKTSKLSIDQIDAIYEHMWEGHLDCVNGPVFSDYDTSGATPASDPLDETEPVETAMADAESALRAWTLKNGKTIEAEYVNTIAGNVVLKTSRGKVIKVKPAEFAAEEHELLGLLNPPKLKIEFKKKTSSFEVLNNPSSSMPIPAAQEFAGGVVIQQQNTKEYTHPLRVELYVVLDERDGNNYILHDRQIETFVLTPENERRFELYAKKSILLRYESYGGYVRGEAYKGYMILVYDERGEIIAQEMSHDWLLDIVEELREFSVGRHFNKEGERVFPPRPRFSNRFWDAAP